MHLYDLLNDLELNTFLEYKRLERLFYSDFSPDSTGMFSSSLIQELNRYFHNLEMQGTAFDIEDFLSSLQLPYHSINPTDCNLNTLLLFSEVLLTLFLQCESLKIKFNKDTKWVINSIKNNISVICNKINYEIYNKNNYVYISPKSLEVEQAVQNINDKKIAIELLHYNHRELQGDIKKKRDILAQLWNYLEPKYTNKILSKNGYSKIETDFGFYCNNFNIRHNNLDGKKIKQFCVDINNKNELEIWYDKAYNTVIMFILAEKQISYEKELKNLKEQYKL